MTSSLCQGHLGMWVTFQATRSQPPHIQSNLFPWPNLNDATHSGFKMWLFSLMAKNYGVVFGEISNLASTKKKDE